MLRFRRLRLRTGSGERVQVIERAPVLVTGFEEMTRRQAKIASTPDAVAGLREAATVEFIRC